MPNGPAPGLEDGPACRPGDAGHRGEQPPGPAPLERRSRLGRRWSPRSPASPPSEGRAGRRGRRPRRAPTWQWRSPGDRGSSEDPGQDAQPDDRRKGPPVEVTDDRGVALRPSTSRAPWTPRSTSGPARTPGSKDPSSRLPGPLRGTPTVPTSTKMIPHRGHVRDTTGRRRRTHPRAMRATTASNGGSDRRRAQACDPGEPLPRRGSGKTSAQAVREAAAPVGNHRRPARLHRTNVPPERWSAPPSPTVRGERHEPVDRDPGVQRGGLDRTRLVGGASDAPTGSGAGTGR